MGRSVGTLSDATEIVFLSFLDWETSVHNPETDDFDYVKVIDLDPEDYWTHQDAWEDFKEDVVHRLGKAFPSLEDADRWVDREGHVILENGHAAIVLFEYMGSVSVNLVAKQDDHYYDPGARALAQAWCYQVAEKFRGALTCDGLGTLAKLGTMSNGVSVYQRVCN